MFNNFFLISAVCETMWKNFVEWDRRHVTTTKKSQLVSLEFFSDIKFFRSHYGPGVDSASNRNEYQEHFLGVKAAGA